MSERDIAEELRWTSGPLAPLCQRAAKVILQLRADRQACRMTATEYREAIAALGLSQVKAAKLFEVDPRTSRRWAAGTDRVPKAVEIALRLLIKHGGLT